MPSGSTWHGGHRDLPAGPSRRATALDCVVAEVRRIYRVGLTAALHFPDEYEKKLVESVHFREHVAAAPRMVTPAMVTACHSA